MANSSDIRWIIDGDELLLLDHGRQRNVSADEVFRSIIEREPVFDGLAVGPPSSIELKYSRYPADLQIHLDHAEQEPERQFICSITAEGRERQGVIRKFSARKADHVIIDQTWYPFARGSMDEVRKILDEASINDTDHLSFKSFLALRSIAQKSDIVSDKTAGRVITPGLAYDRDPRALKFVGTLYPYQHVGWRWLTFVCEQGLGGVLADEMGLGKTVQLIATLASPERQVYSPSLVVAPTTLLENWRREFHKFAPSIRTLVHQGTQRTGLPDMLRKPDVVITSYETVVRDGSLFGMIDWRIVVLDEAQAIKNPETRRSQAVKRLPRTAGIAVTGTPVENKLRDLWSIFEFAVPGFLGGEAQFEQKFGNDTVGAEELEPYVSPLMLRRRVAEVAKDLPRRIDVPQPLELEAHEAQEYDSIRQRIVAECGTSAMLVALSKLRMFCSHPTLLRPESADPDTADQFCKFARLVEIVDEIFANDEKVIVFTSYNLMSDLITQHIRSKYGVFAATIDGRTEVRERQETVDEFSHYAGPALLSLNPRAAGTGLNITAANHVIHYNLEWNPAVEDQASARAYRRGQTKPVTVHRLFIADTVEEVVDDRLQRKRALADAAVVGVTGTDQDELDDIVRALQLSPV